MPLRSPLSLRAVVAALALASSFGTRPAAAQTYPGYAANTFSPAERGSSWFVLDSLSWAKSPSWVVGSTGHFSRGSIRLQNSDAGAEGEPLKEQWITHVGATYFVNDRVRVGIDLPVLLYANGDTRRRDPFIYRGAVKGVSLGDVRLGADVRIFGETNGLLRLAAGAQLFAPSGSKESYMGDGEPRGLVRVMAAGQRSWFVYAAQLGVLLRGREQAWADGRIGSAVSGAVSMGWRGADDRLVVGPELWLHSTLKGRNDAASLGGSTTPVEALMGAHYDVASFRLGAGMGTGLSSDYGAPAFRALLSLDWTPPVAAPLDRDKDRDRDGVPDSEDACSFEAGAPSKDPARNGCPAADADRDGVPDERDACPLTPGIASNDARVNGCPADSDNDGIVDREDACPNAAGVRSLDSTKHGCPLRDSDGDGVTDDVDACPTAPGIRSPVPQQNGCPDPDPDHDGVLGEADACPNDRGVPDPDPKKNGCPRAFLQEKQIRITDNVTFAPATAQITGRESEAVLEAVLGVLAQHPEITSVVVEGHTDNQGDPNANKALSKQRADAVIAWLVKHGQPKTKFTGVGRGQERPRGSNATEEARAANRRVEFHVEAAPSEPAAP